MTQTTTLGDASNTGTNGVCISSPHVTQVRVPRRDDGKWMSIGALIGTIIGKLASADLIDKAKEAEDIWRTMTDLMKDKGIEEFGVHAQMLRTCTDDLWTKLCAFATCGYQPDYDGILTRARADAALATASKRAEICRYQDRYNVAVSGSAFCDLMRTEILATVGAANAARENERQMMWKYNGDLLANTTIRFEQAYQNRIKLGADLMASAGENYAFLAESLRRTAKDDTSDMAAFGSVLGVLLPLLFLQGCGPIADCGC